MAIICGLNITPVSRLKKTWDVVERTKHISIYKDLFEGKMSYRGNYKAYRQIEMASKPPFIPFFGLFCKDLIFYNDGNQKHLDLPISSPGRTEVRKNIDRTASDDDLSLASSYMPTSTLGSAIGASGTDMQLSGIPETDTNPIPDRQPLVNFEKCRSIFEKIHAIRVFQQSSYKFSEENQEEKDSSFFRSQPTQEELADALLSFESCTVVTDEKELMRMSLLCEPR